MQPAPSTALAVLSGSGTFGASLRGASGRRRFVQRNMCVYVRVRVRLRAGCISAQTLHRTKLHEKQGTFGRTRTGRRRRRGWRNRWERVSWYKCDSHGQKIHRKGESVPVLSSGMRRKPGGGPPQAMAPLPTQPCSPSPRLSLVCASSFSAAAASSASRAARRASTPRAPRKISRAVLLICPAGCGGFLRALVCACVLGGEGVLLGWKGTWHPFQQSRQAGRRGAAYDLRSPPPPPSLHSHRIAPQGITPNDFLPEQPGPRSQKKGHQRRGP